jgi:glucose-1-phosphate thymidylyltransferase
MIIHPKAAVSSSIILGPTIIGRGVRVSNSYVGPYTPIGAGAEIKGAEVSPGVSPTRMPHRYRAEFP